MGEVMLWFLYFITLVAKGSAVAIIGVQEGVNADTGERPFRQEFSVFKDSGAAFDLYIQALYYFTQESQDNEQSYFSIAGIHGYPFVTWDGVEGDFQAGYCTHESILFPTWHRPYLALFEQTLWKYAQDAATQYPDDKRAEYVAAAKTLRIPYWDWALDVRIPDIVNSPTVNINLPDGPCNCPNPLYEYRFHPLPPDPLFPEGTDLNLFDRTVRSPDDNGESQPENSNRRLEANGNALKTLIYQLIASQSQYGPFSNTAYSDERSGRYNNIENIHNAIHTFIGNGGHMSNIPYSSFDPIFWLHHASVDRLFAIWQAVHPTSYTIRQSNAVGTFTEAPGFVETADSRKGHLLVTGSEVWLTAAALTPFHSDNAGNFYTSTTVRSTRSFGYSYPDIVDWGVTTAQLSSNVRAKFNALYNPTGSIQARSASSNDSHVSTVSSNGAGHQWMVNIRVDKSALPTSFYIHFFLGEVPDATETWGYAPNLIASHAVLLPRSHSTSKEYISYGQIPLTSALLRSPFVPDLKPESVVPVLTKQLNWRIQTLKNKPVATEKVTSLKLYVAGQEVHQWDVQTKDKLPLYGPLVPYRGITKGKAGALGEDDPL